MFLPCPTRRKELAMSVADQLGLTQVVRNTTRRCPAHMDGLVDMGPLDLFVHAVSVAGRRWCPQGCHRDIQSLGHGRQVVDRPPRLTPKPHGQRRITQTHFGRKALLADCSARHPCARLRGPSQAQLIQCALSPGSTIGGPLRPGTRPARGSSAPSTGCLLELIHSPLSHRLIHQFEWHFMICIRTAPLNMADHDTTWGLT